MLCNCHSNCRNATVDKYRIQGNTRSFFSSVFFCSFPFLSLDSIRLADLPCGYVKSGKYSHRHSIDSFIQQRDNLDVFMTSSERFTVPFVCIIVFVMRFLSTCRSSCFERKLWMSDIWPAVDSSTEIDTNDSHCLEFSPLRRMIWSGRSELRVT